MTNRLSFTLDGQVSLVDDYLELRPTAEPRIRALVEAGRLHIGPWYTQADTLLADGEALVRNLAWGVRRADQLGGHMPIGYMADQFGHAAQLPQLFRIDRASSGAILVARRRSRPAAARVQAGSAPTAQRRSRRCGCRTATARDGGCRRIRRASPMPSIAHA